MLSSSQQRFSQMSNDETRNVVTRGHRAESSIEMNGFGKEEDRCDEDMELLGPAESGKPEQKLGNLSSKYRTTWYRWPVLLVFSACIMINIGTNVGFATVAIPIQLAFNMQTAYQVNMCSLAFPIVTIPMSLSAIWLFQNFSIGNVLRVAAFLQFAGLWTRYAVFYSDSFHWVLIGTFISACSSPIFLSAQSIIANKWFSEKERALAQGVCIAAMPLGTIASFAITGSYFANTEGNRKEQFQNLMSTQNTISFVIFAAFMTIYKEQPDFPPSSVALHKPARVDLLSAIKGFFTNRNYLMLTLSFSLTQGLLAAIGTLLSSIFDPLGVEPARISLLGGILLVSGMLSAPLVGIFLDRTRKYVLTVRVLSVLLAASFCFVLFSMQRVQQHFDLMMLNMAICGACAVAYLPATLALANELTFPLQPAASVGLMNIGGSIIAFCLGIFGTWMTTVNPDDNRGLSQEEIDDLSIHYSMRTLRMFAACSIVASSFLFSVKEDLRRLKFDKQQELLMQEEDNEDQS